MCQRIPETLERGETNTTPSCPELLSVTCSSRHGKNGFTDTTPGFSPRRVATDTGDPVTKMDDTDTRRESPVLGSELSRLPA